MPEEYALGNKEIYIQSIGSNKPAYSPDGKFLEGAPETALKVLQAFDPNVQGKTIDLSKTYHEQVRRQGERGELTLCPARDAALLSGASQMRDRADAGVHAIPGLQRITACCAAPGTQFE